MESLLNISILDESIFFKGMVLFKTNLSPRFMELLFSEMIKVSFSKYFLGSL